MSSLLDIDIDDFCLVKNHVHAPDPEKCAQEYALLMNMEAASGGMLKRTVVPRPQRNRAAGSQRLLYSWSDEGIGVR